MGCDEIRVEGFDGEDDEDDGFGGGSGLWILRICLMTWASLISSSSSVGVFDAHSGTILFMVVDDADIARYRRAEHEHGPFGNGVH